MNRKKPLPLMLSVGVIIALASACGTAATSPSPTPRDIVELAEDGAAYVRVSETETLTDSKDPVGEVFQLKFGDEVTLLQKHDAFNAWLVSRDGKEGWLYSFYLTSDTSEIDFLTEIDRIPATMSYIAEDNGDVYIQGYYTQSIVIDSMNSSGSGSAHQSGLSMAKEGNAILFDENAAKLDPPYMVMQCGEKTCELSPDRMYYITSVDSEDNANFECLDLRALSKCDE